MSGGSYNYLCRQIWSGDPISLRDLASMRDRLNNLAPGSAAARDTAALYVKLSAAQDNELDALAQVWHDVEWFDSSDYSEDQALAGIAKYENAQLADRAESAAPGDLAARLLDDDRPLFASDKVTVPDFSTWNSQLGGFLVPQTIRDEVMSLAMGTTMLGRVAAMTPEERAAVEQQRRAALDGIAQAHAQLLADVDELAAEILLLHAPQLDNLVTCSGCDFSGHEGEPPEWPCRTYTVVATRNGRQFVGEFEPYGPRMEVRK